jgi:hypothetical protein
MFAWCSWDEPFVVIFLLAEARGGDLVIFLGVKESLLETALEGGLLCGTWGERESLLGTALEGGLLPLCGKCTCVH